MGPAGFATETSPYRLGPDFVAPAASLNSGSAPLPFFADVDEHSHGVQPVSIRNADRGHLSLHKLL